MTKDIEKSEFEPTAPKTSEREFRYAEEPKAAEDILKPKELRDEEGPTEVEKSLTGRTTTEKPEAKPEETEQVQGVKYFNEMKEPEELCEDVEEHRENEHQLAKKERTAVEKPEEPGEVNELEQAQSTHGLDKTEEPREDISTTKDPEESAKPEETIEPTETDHQKESVSKSKLNEIEKLSQETKKVEGPEENSLTKGAHEPLSIQKSDKSTETIEPEQLQQDKNSQEASAPVVVNHALASNQPIIESSPTSTVVKSYHEERSAALKDIHSEHPASDLVVPPPEANTDERMRSVANQHSMEDAITPASEAAEHDRHNAASESLSMINANEATAATVAAEGAHVKVFHKDTSQITDAKEPQSSIADETSTTIPNEAPMAVADEATTRVLEPQLESSHGKAPTSMTDESPTLSVNSKVLNILNDEAPAIALDKEVLEVIPAEEAPNDTTEKAPKVLTGLAADIVAPTLAVGILAAGTIAAKKQASLISDEEEAPTFTTEEAPVVVAEQKLPALISERTSIEEDPAAPVNREVPAVNVKIEKDISMSTADEVSTIGAIEETPALTTAKTIAAEAAAASVEREMPTITIGNNSAPFLARSAVLDIGEQKKSDEPQTNSMNGAKSTSFEDIAANGNGLTELKIRNVSTTERALTPASVHSTLKSKDSDNFFQALWRTVFVGWIGGLITWLFGGGRGPLFAVCAVLLLGSFYFLQTV